MKVYIFGNQDLEEDNTAFKVADKVKNAVEGVQFVAVKPNEDLPFVGVKHVVIMDTVRGIDKVEIIQDEDLERLVLSPGNTVHDFDLGFQIKYLKKLEKIGRVTIIGLPQDREVNYLRRIQSILRKLVAQDMHGS